MYEAYSDYESMMNMAEEIVTRSALTVNGKLTVDYQVNWLRSPLLPAFVLSYLLLKRHILFF